MTVLAGSVTAPTDRDDDDGGIFEGEETFRGDKEREEEEAIFESFSGKGGDGRS